MKNLSTSYRDLDNHVIYKRTRSIDSSDTGEEDNVHKRMHEDKEEYRRDDEEEYDDDKDELESSEFNSHILQMSLLSTSGF